MSTQNSGDSTNHEFESVIAGTYRRVLAARQAYREAQLADRVTGRHIKDLAVTAEQYRTVLYEFRDEDALDPEWDERDLDWLDDYLGETVEVEVPGPGMTRNTQTESIPAIQTVDPERIVELTRNLDDVRRELGFAANVDESTPRTEIDDELLDKVEQWRQQNVE